MAEQNSTDRTRDESDGERRVGEQDADERILIRKEQLVEHEPGDDAVQKEIVPLDDAADRARERNALDFPGVRSSAYSFHAVPSLGECSNAVDDHVFKNPPSTAIVSPVMNDARSD